MSLLADKWTMLQRSMAILIGLGVVLFSPFTARAVDPVCTNGFKQIAKTVIPKKKIVIVSGTNRAGSYTLQVSELMKKELEAQGAEVQILDLQKIPRKDLGPNRYWNTSETFKKRFEKPVLGADGLVFVVPEYNGSFPGILKHFTDLLKYPDSFKNKPVQIVGLSAGRWGDIRGADQLANVLQYPGAHVYGQRVYIPGVEQAVKDGAFTDASMTERTAQTMQGFLEFVEKLKAPAAKSEEAAAEAVTNTMAAP